MKILAVLYLLAHGLTWDVVEDVAQISSNCLRVFSKRWLHWLLLVHYPRHVRLPEGEELRTIMSIFARLGFPGAVASMDATHVVWDSTDNTGKDEAARMQYLSYK